MKQAKNVFPIFSLLFLLTLILLFFSQNTLLSPLQNITLPIQKWTFSSFNPQQIVQKDVHALKEENDRLRVQLAKLQEIERDNKALHDQFAQTTPAHKNLLPADIIGVQENKMMVDKGSESGIREGDIAIVKDNVIGIISKVSPKVSVITLITDPSTSFTAIASKTKAIGVVKAQGTGKIIFDNVVLSEKLEKNDIVMTKGDVGENGKGIPPGFVVGEIASVKKKDSNLFQQAELHSLINFAQLRIVFIIKD